jgi:hypothetical protein
MNYKENVEKKISGETNELTRRRELLKKIVGAYEKGGEGEIKSILTERSDEITSKFNKSLGQLEKRL